ncbi:MAG: hypothetical protein WA667_26250 [Candidatus Nitrosopolaris sp.]
MISFIRNVSNNSSAMENKLIATTIGLALVITVSVLGTAYTQSAFALSITTNGGGGGGGGTAGNGGTITVTGATAGTSITGGGNTINHGNANGGDANGGRGGDAGVTVSGSCNHSSTC